ncbi:MAG: IS110 family transposase [Bacilli bacterium]|nr:IS110 family transposase [Bacilli bacterium]
MKSVLSIDIANGKSEVLLITEYGEVLIEPYEIKHCLNDFNLLKDKIDKFKLDDLTVFMESTSTYHLPIQRFFTKNNYNVQVINPILSKNNTRNLRKTKTDIEDCYNLADLFFKNTVKIHTKNMNDIYSSMIELSRQEKHLTESLVRTKNRFKQIIANAFPEYIKCFTANDIFGKTSLNFIKEFPHADIIKEKRIDALAKNLYKSCKNGCSYDKCLTKAKKIKELANNSYPGIDIDSCEVSNLINIVDIISYNDSKLNDVKQDIVKLAKQTPYFNIINSIYGVGETSTAQIIAELGDINRFENIKQLNAFCGLDPTIVQSGKSINYHGPISKRGNRNARKILFITCCSIIRSSVLHNVNNEILIYYRKKQAENKHFKECIIACSTKLLRIIFAMCKNNSLYMQK